MKPIFSHNLPILKEMCSVCEEEHGGYDFVHVIAIKNNFICRNCVIEAYVELEEPEIREYLIEKIKDEIIIRKSMTMEIKKIIFERDNHQCVSCGAKERLEIDHKIPVTKGGTNELDNLQVLCRSCNSSKGNKLNWKKKND